MDDIKPLRRILCQYFWDHNHSRALGITYPVSPLVHLGRTRLNLHQKECLEAYLNYPCFQVYVASPEPFLENLEGQKQAISLVSRILSGLEQEAFFTVVDGVRLELYNGRSEFGQTSNSGKLNQLCLKAIGEHSVNERECRNELAYLRATVHQRLLSHRQHCPAMKGNQDTDRDQLGWILFEGQVALVRTHTSGDFASSEITPNHSWTNGNHIEVHEFSERRRRKSTSDLDTARGCSTNGGLRSHHFRSLSVPGPSIHTSIEQRPRLPSNSPGGDTIPLALSAEQSKCFRSCQSALLRHLHQHEADVDSEPHLSKCVENLITAAMSKFHPLFVPNSFCSLPYQPWHSLVIVVRDLVGVDEELFAMWFNKEHTSEGPLDLECAVPREFRYEVQYVTTTSDQYDKQSPSLSDLLKYSMRLLGLSNPSMECLGVTTDVPSYWFIHQAPGQQVLDLEDEDGCETCHRSSLVSESRENDSMSWIFDSPKLQHIQDANKIVKHPANPFTVASLEQDDEIID